MRSQLKVVITAGLLCHLFLTAPLVISQALPQSGGSPGAGSSHESACHIVLTAPPVFQKPQTVSGSTTQEGQAEEPKKPKVPISEQEPVSINADECEKDGALYTLHGNVGVTFGDFTFHGDTVTYDSNTGDASTSGNVSLDGGMRDMHIAASHATYNVRSRTGKFYDVTGTTGARFQGKNVTLTSSNPIAFTGKLVEQTGPEEYVLHEGSVTSCELPHPKWTFNASTIILRVGNSAHIYNTTFRLKGVPILYLPYAAPPVERLERQSGFLIPNFGTSSSKGTILGDSFYWAINRSMDATLGGEYLSKRGWSLQEVFRAVPSDRSYLNFNYFQVLDRGIVQNVQQAGAPAGTTVPQTVDQGGEDVKLNGGNVPSRFSRRSIARLSQLIPFPPRLYGKFLSGCGLGSQIGCVSFQKRQRHVVQCLWLAISEFSGHHSGRCHYHPAHPGL
jgi:LptD protein